MINLTHVQSYPTRYSHRPRTGKTSPSLPFLCMAACLCVYTCLYVCLHVCICVFVCACMCACMCASVCVPLASPEVCLLTASGCSRGVSVESVAHATYRII